MAASRVRQDHSLLGVRDTICAVIIFDWFIGLFFFKLRNQMSSLSPALERLKMSFYFSAHEISCTCLSDTDDHLWFAVSKDLHCCLACTNQLPSQHNCLALCRVIYFLTQVIP